MRSVTFLVTVWVMLSLLGCFNSSTGVGAGHEGEASIAGVILGPDSVGLKNVEVSLIPKGFNPTLSEIPDSLKTKTDEHGKFSILVPDSTTYNLTAVHDESQLAVFLSDISFSDIKSTSIILAPAVLLKTGKLTIHLSESGLVKHSEIYILGTEISVQVDEQSYDSGVVTISEMPSGAYDNISYTSTDNEEHVLVESPVEIEPDETKYIGPYDAWSVRKTVTINTSSIPAPLSSNLHKIPVLVRLTSEHADIFESAKINGDDLRFTKSDGVTPMFFEVESWSVDASNPEASIWVYLDTLYKDEAQQHFFLYIGRSKAQPSTFRKGVFNMYRGYFAVWHFVTPVTPPSYEFTDFSDFGNNARFLGDTNQYALTPGIAGKGFSLNDTLIAIASKIVAVNPNIFTLSTWFKTSSTTGSVIFSFNGGISHDRMVWMDDMGYIHFGVFQDTTNSNTANISEEQGVKTVSSVQAYNDGEWHFLTARLSEDGLFLFIDGEEVDSDPSVTYGANRVGYWNINYGIIWETAKVNPVSGMRFIGTLDECRIMNQPKSASGIRFSYWNERPDSDIIQIQP